ncbi:hypothetical protein MGG_15125 [Pyricularia oryzae 70-15]|uniref:Uncharacterized protein n=1 Tax=Pyricularia oryzae (strain 70-15 / ATCC MYA-4617 / FGSC 8958) TaxID=242507 RepID=G4N464_PYRO7|nr:uncharacterized protein MGG_15125 [Pyricularia oryzae 70-15]EHA52784.1 hypothetical protein MGG_15125 [Pyricularia oryzae 70-15]KAI7918939.1 hypothetical protein M9X92_006640 [Pyricularia oryzae]KAI7929029.1 hypothetical protein M0657_002465 [Pyricularia oryzae]
MACRFERWQRAGHPSPHFPQTLFDFFVPDSIRLLGVFFCARSMVRDAHPNLVSISLVWVRRTEISHPVLRVPL